MKNITLQFYEQNALKFEKSRSFLTVATESAIENIDC